MKIALVGYGKMGQLIDQLAPEYGIEVGRSSTNITTPTTGITAENFQGCRRRDRVLDSAQPSSHNIERLAALGVNTVVGTTGWAKDFDRVSRLSRRAASASSGVRTSPSVSRCFPARRRSRAPAQGQPEYGAWAWEIHHDTKADAPSGTLLKLVGDMKSAGYTRNIDVSSNRAGRHPGTHEIGFDSAADTITLRHAARSREGFARGALKAAQWIHGKRGMYEFGETLFS